MSAASKLLDRLDGVRQTAPMRWVAKCPGHQDRSPSLSIRELDDGRVLLHDFAGCDTSAVLSVLGLSLGDLFERPLQHHCAPSASRPSIPHRHAAEVLAELDNSVLVAGFIIERAAETGSPLSKEARWVLRKCVATIGKARDAIGPVSLPARIEPVPEKSRVG